LWQKVVDQYIIFCYNIDMLSSKAQHFLNCKATLKGNIMSATEKTFTVAGTAINADGTVKARFANDLVARIKILNKAGCTEINLVELPRAMTKMEALQHLQTLGITEGDAGYVVANKLAERAKVAKKGEVKVVATGVKAKAKSTVTAEQLVEAAKA
jgi:hypothetical protein